MNEPIQIDRYQIRKALGQGGMAVVYLAHDLELKREVCLKVILPQWASRPLLVQRFMREAQAMARLRHANVIQVFDIGQTGDGRPYFTMEFVSGGTLQDRIGDYWQERALLPSPMVLAIMGQVAAGLQAIHQAGMVHRDLKPANILLRADGTAIVADLGIVAVDNASVRLTNTGKVPGTPAYMSPEQAGGRQVNAQTDIYACGIILFQLLSGRLPFDGDALSILHQHLHEPPPDLRLVRPDLPPDIYQLVESCLQKSLATRLPSAANLINAIEQAESSLVGETPALDNSNYRPPRKESGANTRPIPWPIIGAGLGLLAIVLTLALIAYNGRANNSTNVAATHLPTTLIAETEPTASAVNSVIIITPTPLPDLLTPDAAATNEPNQSANVTSSPTLSITALPTSTPLIGDLVSEVAGESSVAQSTPVLNCQTSAGEPWGGNYYDRYQNQLGCPQTPAISPTAAFQIYNKGLMLWRADSNVVTILFYQDGKFEQYEVSDIPATYPGQSDMLKGAFGYLWNTYAHISDKLQNPTFPEANPNNFVIQDFSGGVIFYFYENNANTYVLFHSDQSWFTPFD